MQHHSKTSTPSSRRSFLKMTMAGGMLGILPNLKSAPGFQDKPEKLLETDWVDIVRSQLPALKHCSYFQTGAFGPSPTSVINKQKQFLDLQNEGPAHPEYFKQLKAAENSCRPLIAKTFGAHPEEVALTYNTTSGLNIALWGENWNPEDEIIISDQEHPALLLPTYNLAERFGVKFRFIKLDSKMDIVGQVLEELSPKTRMVALSHVSRNNGHVVPAKALTAELRQRGVKILLDGAQGPGNIPVNFHEIGCDFYSLCGHKWLLGPKGTGALLIRKDQISSSSVSWTGSHAQKQVNPHGEFTWHPDARRYEFGTRNQAAFGGFAEAIHYLESIGWDRIYNRIQYLSSWTSQQIIESPRLQLVSPRKREDQNGIVVLRLPDGMEARSIYEACINQHSILLSPLSHPQDIRICTHFFNTEEEISKALAQLNSFITQPIP